MNARQKTQVPPPTKPLRRNRWGAVPWTAEETEKLRSVYSFIFPEEAAQIFPGRDWKSIRGKGANLKLGRGRREILFPRQYTNDQEGGYVSGLVDGEGWFMVSLRKKEDGIVNYNPKFGISLRIDDIEILNWVRDYFNCGYVNTSLTKNHSPMATYCVADLYGIMKSLIPHFTSYPLRARKRFDYGTWLEIVNLQAENFRQYWTPSVRNRMADLYEKLKVGRRYCPPTV